MSGQGTLFACPRPSTADWARWWEIDLLDPCPVRGFATATDWAGTASGTTDYPGRNHPGLGNWLAERYAGSGPVADCMVGVGGLHLAHQLEVFGCDVSATAVELARQNLGERAAISRAKAESWTPVRKVTATIFSPMFEQSHSSGTSEHQQQIRQAKRSHAVQQFEAGAQADMRAVYRQILEYCTGAMCVIVRNRIENNREVDEIGPHIRLMRETGWHRLSGHARMLRPTIHQQWKVARDPTVEWLRSEWVIVGWPDAKGGCHVP